MNKSSATRQRGAIRAVVLLVPLALGGCDGDRAAVDSGVGEADARGLRDGGGPDEASPTRQAFGGACQLGIPADPLVSAINPGALECASRICLLPASPNATNTTGPLCTAFCNTDDDCAGGQRRGDPVGLTTGGNVTVDGGAVPVDNRCTTRFVCGIVIPNLEHNPLSCRRVCVCREFVPVVGLPTPASCQ